MVPVVTPLALVGAAGCRSVLPEPVAVNVAVWPASSTLLVDRIVIVMVEMATPSAETPNAGLAVAVDNVALMRTDTKSTVGCCATTTWPAPGLIVAVMVFSWAVVLAMVPVATPLAFVAPGWTSVLLVPVEARLTAWPATG